MRTEEDISRQSWERVQSRPDVQPVLLFFKALCGRQFINLPKLVCDGPFRLLTIESVTAAQQKRRGAQLLALAEYSVSSPRFDDIIDVSKDKECKDVFVSVSSPRDDAKRLPIRFRVCRVASEKWCIKDITIPDLWPDFDSVQEKIDGPLKVNQPHTQSEM